MTAAQTAASGPMTMDVITIVIAIASLLIVVYQEFLRGAKLKITANAISLLRLAANNKSRVLLDLLCADLLSTAPSPSSQVLLTDPTVAAAVQSKLEHVVRQAVVQFSTQQEVNYDPPANLLEKVPSNPHFSFNFMVPLYAYNTGKRTAFARSLVLVLAKEDEPSEQWVFTPFLELDEMKLMSRAPGMKDQERVKGMFAGLSVPPSSAARLTPWFIPMTSVDKNPINDDPIFAGRYNASIKAYDGRGRRVCSTVLGAFEIQAATFGESLRGAESMIYLHTEDDVKDALGL